MKEVPLIITLHAAVLGTFIWFMTPVCADSSTDYKAGSDFAKQVQGGGLDALKNFNGEQTLPGYTSRPDQTKSCFSDGCMDRFLSQIICRSSS